MNTNDACRSLYSQAVIIPSFGMTIHNTTVEGGICNGLNFIIAAMKEI